MKADNIAYLFIFGYLKQVKGTLFIDFKLDKICNFRQFILVTTVMVHNSTTYIYVLSISKIGDVAKSLYELLILTLHLYYLSSMMSHIFRVVFYHDVVSEMHLRIISFIRI